MTDLFLPGPAGRLQASVWPAPRGASARASCALCHPHPLYGGTMNNTPVFRTARGLQQAGLRVLRFNFRGVGASAGEHDGHGGEEADLGAALDWLERENPRENSGSELWAGGFSFGARIAGARAVVDQRIARILLVALPVDAFDCSFLRELRQPGLILMAEKDEYGTLASLRSRFPDLPAGLELAEIPGAGHFFEGATQELQKRVRAYAERVTRSPT